MLEDNAGPAESELLLLLFLRAVLRIAAMSCRGIPLLRHERYSFEGLKVIQSFCSEERSL